MGNQKRAWYLRSRATSLGQFRKGCGCIAPQVPVSGSLWSPSFRAESRLSMLGRAAQSPTGMLLIYAADSMKFLGYLLKIQTFRTNVLLNGGGRTWLLAVSKPPLLITWRVGNLCDQGCGRSLQLILGPMWYAVDLKECYQSLRPRMRQKSAAYIGADVVCC